MSDGFVPKLMLTFGGKPLLERHLSWLKAAGVESICLCLGVRADAVRVYFGDGSRWGVKLRYFVEDTPLGTAGSVKALGAASLPEDLVALEADLIPEFDCQDILEFHRSHTGLATVAVRPVGLEGDGLRAINSGSPQVVIGPGRRIMEMPQTPKADAGGASGVGLGVIRRPLLHFVPDRGASDFLRDIFPAAVRAGEDLRAYPLPGELHEIGTPELYATASKRLG